MLKVAFSPTYIYLLPEGHRFPMIKYELLRDQLEREGTLESSNFFSPRTLQDTSILLTHTETYLDKLNRLLLSKKEERAIGFPVREDLIQRGKHIAGGTFDCAINALEHGISMNIAGGTHHSFADRGEGFCVFNDVAIASNLLLAHEHVKQILVIDLDVHQGNGTAKIFEEEPQVFSLSFHGAKNYPLRKEQSDLDVEFADGTRDAEYLGRLRNILPGIIETVQPDIAFYISGVDILESDQLGRLSISKQGCLHRDQFVLQQCKRNNIPLVVVMGGGYSKRISEIVEAHANTFRVAQELYF